MALKITDIRHCWESIKPGLEVIARKCAAEWRVEDVYARCVNNEWTLFTAEGVDGFLIVSQSVEEYRDGKILFIHRAYYAGTDDPFEEYEPFLFELAAQIGAKRLEFRSPRLGYRRKGWRVADVIYRKEIDDGK